MLLRERAELQIRGCLESVSVVVGWPDTFQKSQRCQTPQQEEGAVRHRWRRSLRYDGWDLKERRLWRRGERPDELADETGRERLPIRAGEFVVHLLDAGRVESAVDVNRPVTEICGVILADLEQEVAAPRVVGERRCERDAERCREVRVEIGDRETGDETVVGAEVAVDRRGNRVRRDRRRRQVELIVRGLDESLSVGDVV